MKNMEALQPLDKLLKMIVFEHAKEILAGGNGFIVSA